MKPEAPVPSPTRARRRPTLVERLLKPACAAAGLVFFGLALWGLQHALGSYRYWELVAAFAALPVERLFLSLGLTVAGYLVLVGYDLLAFRFVGRFRAWGRIAAGSLIANALGNNLGNILITGAAVRYWFYTTLGLSAAQITRVVLFCSLGFWLGYLSLAGGSFLLWPVHPPPDWSLAMTGTELLGGLFLLALAGYGWLVGRRRRLRFARWKVELPSPALTLGQILVASLDLCLMAAALYVLLPAGTPIGFGQFLSIFLLAIISGTVSQVPGGLGVFEAAMVLLLSPLMDPRPLAVALLAFRGIYYVLPLFLAAVSVGLREVLGKRERLGERLQQGKRWLGILAPQVLAAVTFISGAVLLFSGAVPASAGRLALVHGLLSLPIIEVSHFLASLAGAVLLLLARGLQRRLDAAWFLAVMLLATGSLLSLMKGWDFEEATILSISCLTLLPFHNLFYRRSSLLGEPFSAAWAGSVVIVLAAAGWLLSFAQDYGAEPWWQFSLEDEASRSLRATLAAVGLTGLFALRRLLRPMEPVPPPPNPADMERARSLVQASPRTYANLVFRGDKSLLFSRAGDAFLMYGRQGRSWVAMGDPVGSESGCREVAWRFRDLCDRFDGWCVFFEVGPEKRGFYADLGLGLTLLGEEARVDLAKFSLEGSANRALRQARARALRAGCTFEILGPAAVPEVLPRLKRISDAWLARKPTCEKGFSNASFDGAYLSHFPIALVRLAGEPVAFANLWLGAGKEELSVDLMRHLPTAPNGTMDFLFVELFLWGHGEGYRWFNFGMAPLAGLEHRREGRIWPHVGSFVYRHGDYFYNFDGLRRYKAKFNPVWVPLYLASPGGLALAPVLVDVATLMAGSLSGLVSKRPGLGIGGP